MNGHYEIIKMLLEANADVNIKDFYDQNALHYAVRSNNEKICKLICNNKVNSSQLNKNTQMIPRDYSLVAVGSKTSLNEYKEIDYINKLNNIKRAEDPGVIADADEPQTNQEKIYNLILRYDDMNLSDIDSGGEEQHGEVYKKSKKKKKGKSKKGSAKKGKKGGGKKKKKK